MVGSVITTLFLTCFFFPFCAVKNDLFRKGSANIRTIFSFAIPCPKKVLEILKKGPPDSVPKTPVSPLKTAPKTASKKFLHFFCSRCLQLQKAPAVRVHFSSKRKSLPCGEALFKPCAFVAQAKALTSRYEIFTSIEGFSLASSFLGSVTYSIPFS